MTNNVALVGRSSFALAAGAVTVASLALAHTAVALSTGDDAVPAHGRSGFYVVGIAVATLAWSVAIVLTKSAAMGLAGGVLVGGAIANLASLALWPSVDGVPNPLLAGALAFNLADVAVACGLVLVLATTTSFAARNRGRLHDPVRLRS